MSFAKSGFSMGPESQNPNDPRKFPPDPRFLPSLGTLSLVGLAKRAAQGLRERVPQKNSHRTSWGILPQTPVFSLRSACCTRPGGNSDGALPVTTRRAKRENGGLREDPPGSTMTGFHWLGMISVLHKVCHYDPVQYNA
jgi:hypothetical protein